MGYYPLLISSTETILAGFEPYKGTDLMEMKKIVDFI